MQDTARYPNGPLRLATLPWFNERPDDKGKSQKRPALKRGFHYDDPAHFPYGQPPPWPQFAPGHLAHPQHGQVQAAPGADRVGRHQVLRVRPGAGQRALQRRAVRARGRRRAVDRVMTPDLPAALEADRAAQGRTGGHGGAGGGHDGQMAAAVLEWGRLGLDRDQRYLLWRAKADAEQDPADPFTDRDFDRHDRNVDAMVARERRQYGWPDWAGPESAAIPSANGQAMPGGQPWQPAQDPVAARLAQLQAAALTTATLDRVAPVTPVVDGWLYLDTLAWGKGRRGGGKTVAAVDLAGCTGTGTAWHGRPVRQGAVLYLALKSMPGVRQRARAWEALNGRPMTGVTFAPARLSLMDRTDADAVAQWARELGAVLVVVDTQARATPGAEENSNRNTGLFVAALDGIREACGGCVLMLHHMPRDGDNLRGATALEAAASTIIDVSGDGVMVTLRTDDEHGGRQKDAPDPVPITLELAMAGPGLALRAPRAGAVLDAVKASVATVAAMLARCSGPESASALADLTELAPMTVRRALLDLEERFWAVRSGTPSRQFWAATDLCRQAHAMLVNGVSTAPGQPDVLEDSNRSQAGRPLGGTGG